MPRRDGTGPMGAGSMTGRGLGSCTGANAVKYGAGLGLGLGLGLACRRGFGRALEEVSLLIRTPLKHKKSCSKSKRTC